MPAGIEVRDAANNVVMDTTTWVSHQLGSFRLTAGHAAGSLTDVNLANGRPYVIVLPEEGNKGSQSGGNPVMNIVTVSGTTVSWNAAPDACRVIYGIY